MRGHLKSEGGGGATNWITSQNCTILKEFVTFVWKVWGEGESLHHGPPATAPMFNIDFFMESSAERIFALVKKYDERSREGGETDSFNECEHMIRSTFYDDIFIYLTGYGWQGDTLELIKWKYGGGGGPSALQPFNPLQNRNKQPRYYGKNIFLFNVRIWHIISLARLFESGIFVHSLDTYLFFHRLQGGRNESTPSIMSIDIPLHLSYGIDALVQSLNIRSAENDRLQETLPMGSEDFVNFWDESWRALN